ncbi:hypothetical protein [Paenibacillus lutrae]|uniref:hypothetical protein n=1 Tax=Paenibacillus lutrae TaxID=2078573 RepID=UPI0014120D41|nr:hypothetical protein [Paenibacillus lutrae]
MKRYYFFDFPIDLIAVVCVFVLLLAIWAAGMRKGGRRHDARGRQAKRRMD